MEKLCTLISICLLLVVTTSCTAIHDEGSNLSIQSTNPELEAKALQVIERQCSSCHGPGLSLGGVGNLLNVDYLTSSGLIVPGNSNSGRLIGSMQEGTMPKGNKVAESDILIVKEWIDLGFTIRPGGSQTPEGNQPSPPNIVGSPLQIESLTLIQNKCATCHGPSTGGAGGVSDILNVSHLLESGLIVQGNPSQGRLMGSIYDSSMPPSSPLTSAEVTVLENWIRNEINPDAQGELPPPEEVSPTFSSLSRLVLGPKCVACHGPTKADDGVRVDSYEFVMGLTGSKESLVRVGNALESKIYKSATEDMPPRSSGYPKLTEKEGAALRDWINLGALDN